MYKYLVGLTVAASLLALAAFVLWYSALPGPVKVPPAIAERIYFPVYMPRQLPDGYVIQQPSFQEKDGSLIFTAVNTHTEKLVFTEQPMPERFDFARFYKESIRESENLPETPHQTVLGRLPNGNRLLSVTTEKTWLLITTASDLDEASARLIVSSLTKQ